MFCEASRGWAFYFVLGTRENIFHPRNNHKLKTPSLAHGHKRGKKRKRKKRDNADRTYGRGERGDSVLKGAITRARELAFGVSLVSNVQSLTEFFSPHISLSLSLSVDPSRSIFVGFASAPGWFFRGREIEGRGGRTQQG